MASQRDLFANFERMRREMDELFGDVIERTGLAPRKTFTPEVDVYYCGKPARAIVKVAIAGIDPDDVTLEIAIPGQNEDPAEPRALPDGLPVLPLRDTVTFPDTLTPLAVGQERSIQLVNDVLGGERMLAMVTAKDPELEEPGPGELHDVGVAGTVARMIKVPDGTLRILVQGGP